MQPNNPSASKPPRPSASKMDAPELLKKPSDKGPWVAMIMENLLPVSCAKEGKSFWDHNENPPTVPFAIYKDIRVVLPKMLQQVSVTPKEETVEVPCSDLKTLLVWASGLQIDISRWITIAAFIQTTENRLLELLTGILEIKDPAERGKAFSKLMKELQ